MNPISPYLTPTTSPSDANAEIAAPQLRIWKRVRLISAILLILLPINGIISTVWEMIGAFEVLSRSKAADPSELAANISAALLSTFWGLVFALPALIALVVSIFRIRKLHRPQSP